jgi:tetratricopeptide (TPR) repeat protein
LAEALAIAESPGHEPYKELLAWIKVSRSQLELSKQNFPAAISQSQAALKLAGSEFKAIAVQAGSALGLAQSLLGQAAAGRKNCNHAVELAKTVVDPLPLSQARLSLAQAAADSGDAQTALATVQQARSGFADAKQRESEWRCLFIEAEASAKLGNNQSARESAAEALLVLSTMQSEWGSDNYLSYSGRADVRELFGKLKKIQTMP